MASFPTHPKHPALGPRTSLKSSQTSVFCRPGTRARSFLVSNHTQESPRPPLRKRFLRRKPCTPPEKPSLSGLVQSQVTEKQLWESTHVMRSTDKTTTRPCSAPAPSAVSLGLTGVRGRPLSSLYPTSLGTCADRPPLSLKLQEKTSHWSGLGYAPNREPITAARELWHFHWPT